MNFSNVVDKATVFSYKGSTIFRYTEPFSEEASEAVAITKCARYNLISALSAMRFEEIPQNVFRIFEDFGIHETIDVGEVWFNMFDELTYLFKEGDSYEEVLD